MIHVRIDAGRCLPSTGISPGARMPGARMMSKSTGSSSSFSAIRPPDSSMIPLPTLSTRSIVTDQLTPEKILQTGLAFWPAKTLLSAVEIGVFTELAHGPEPHDSLAGRLGLHPRSSRDFLDTLVALGFLARTGDVYANTPETDLFLDRHKPSYVGGILEMANRRLYPFWGGLTEALRTGLPQNEVKSGGAGLFQTLYADPARL